ncbi:hypothetical protein GCM10010365_20340 [Streptomyces poonensis]|uniref:50S ribosomal protein L28 n=1 Tax=Streptomyces poonensis TaxID=68255 RepID=A0A918UEM6_9ACTN|nr:hypothetical protein GCM10010365_20340 [Streptomyces poonensis]GLJ90352.1 hypothetical protein GCM10017589_29550 [Streptomyces poonensis]
MSGRSASQNRPRLRAAAQQRSSGAYWLPSEGRYVRLTLSAKAISTVDSIGIEAAVARIRARGGKA